jgi:hypothetical protein
MHGGIVHPLLRALVAATRYGAEVIIPDCLGFRSYESAREFLVEEALRHEVDYLWFVDQDAWVPENTFEVMERSLRTTSAAIGCAHAYIRGLPFTPMWFKYDEAGVSRCCTASEGSHEIDSGGLHCALLDMKWFREHFTQRPVFSIKRRAEGYGEDTWLCREIKALGGKVIGVGDVRTGHVYMPVLVNDKTAEILRRTEIAYREANGIPLKVTKERSE